MLDTFSCGIIVTLPVFICEAGAVGPHSELAEELTEPLLDLNPLLSAFVHAGPLSSTEAVAVVHSRVVKARHAERGRKRHDEKLGVKRRLSLNRTHTDGQKLLTASLSREKLNSFLQFPASRFCVALLPGLRLAERRGRALLLVRGTTRQSKGGACERSWREKTTGGGAREA